MTDWHNIPEPLQLQLAQAALKEATKNLAAYADALAGEMEAGFMNDRGGQDALRLFANLIRAVNHEETGCVGNA